MTISTSTKKRAAFATISGLLIAAGLLTWRLLAARRFAAKVTDFFSLPDDVSGQQFHYDQLDELPAPVQRYFRHVLKDGQPYISAVRLRHGGKFRPGLRKDWVPIRGEQYFTTATPGFIWKGRTLMFTATDEYVAGKGRLVVLAGGLINVVDESGAELDQGELLRWLGESVWFPTNLLPGEKLQWLPVDEHTAKLVFTHQGLNVSYDVTINDTGEITQLETQRFMGKTLETWVIKLSEYLPLNSMRVPTVTEAIWRLKDGDVSYAKFDLKEIEYDVARPF